MPVIREKGLTDWILCMVSDSASSVPASGSSMEENSSLGYQNISEGRIEESTNNLHDEEIVEHIQRQKRVDSGRNIHFSDAFSQIPLPSSCWSDLEKSFRYKRRDPFYSEPWLMRHLLITCIWERKHVRPSTEESFRDSELLFLIPKTVSQLERDCLICQTTSSLIIPRSRLVSLKIMDRFYREGIDRYFYAYLDSCFKS